MESPYYLTRAEIAGFLPNPRAQQRFDLMQRTVSVTEGVVASNLSDTESIGQATYLTLSANAQLTNERIFRWSNGLTLNVDDNFATLSLTTDVPRTTGGFKVTFVCEGDSAVSVPLTGALATLANVETLSNKTLENPLLSGSNAEVDTAIRLAPTIEGLLKQGKQDRGRADEIFADLNALIEGARTLENAA